MLWAAKKVLFPHSWWTVGHVGEEQHEGDAPELPFVSFQGEARQDHRAPATGIDDDRGAPGSRLRRRSGFGYHTAYRAVRAARHVGDAVAIAGVDSFGACQGEEGPVELAAVGLPEGEAAREWVVGDTPVGPVVP